jgi:hypothetical protein
VSVARKSARRVQQLRLDVGNEEGRRLDAPDHPRPIAYAVGDYLGRNLPPPAAAADLLLELDATERATWYRMAGVAPWRRGEYEETYRRRLAHQYRRRKRA